MKSAHSPARNYIHYLASPLTCTGDLLNHISQPNSYIIKFITQPLKLTCNPKLHVLC